ncbi:MAG: prepilin-type N-terminal cleavage/methylation domain-containing protein [Magnetococcales bacterium]|nr:prepilin-type N-terminal cleavage/methylation domain-containing protein [Magnetococcales bacterium]
MFTAMYNPRKRRSEQGFTLVEIMVCMVLTGILIAGMVGVWGMVAEQFFHLSLRQKAIFVLHGNMERLAQLYRAPNKGINTNSTTGYSHASPDPAVAAVDYPHQIFSVTDGSPKDNDLLMEKTALPKFDSVMGLGSILYLGDTTSPDNSDRNVVWLDRDNRLVARLSWTLDTSSPPPAGCAGTGGCQLLTLYLDYPYRFLAGTDPSKTDPPVYTVETVSVKTIVGQRK